jgi:hypothetical protein
MEVSGQLHALAALPRDKNPWYPLDTRLSEQHSRFGRYRQREKSLVLAGIRIPAVQPAAHRYTD